MRKIQPDISVLFQKGSADLTDSDIARIRHLALIHAEEPVEGFIIFGRTDQLPIHNPETVAKFATNAALSLARAKAVEAVLIETIPNESMPGVIVLGVEDNGYVPPTIGSDRRDNPNFRCAEVYIVG